MPQLTLDRRGDSGVLVRRGFAAPPEAIYRAHTEPQLLKTWLTGPEGWAMIRCQHGSDGSIRYDWADDAGQSFYLTGQFLALEPFRRILHVERMHLPEVTPDNRVETLFHPDTAGGTRLEMLMEVPDNTIREAMLSTDMAEGMEQSYRRLDRLAL